MNARTDFDRGTGWEPDYVSGRRRDAAIVGYRGPFPTGGQATETVDRLLGPLLATIPLSATGAIKPSDPVDLVTGTDRLVIAWRRDRAVGVLTAGNVNASGLSGWFLTGAAVDHERRRRRLLRELVQVLVSEEPSDFVSALSNLEAVYKALSWSSPGAAMHPNRRGLHPRRVGVIAAEVLGQVFADSDPRREAGPDLVVRGAIEPRSVEAVTAVATPSRAAQRSSVLPKAVQLKAAQLTTAEPASTQPETAQPTTGDGVVKANGDGDEGGRFRSSLVVGEVDAVFMVGDVSGAIGAPQRARSGLARLTVKERLRNIAVTGTNGKTSCVELGRQLGMAGDLQSASFGTLGVMTGRGRHRTPQVGVGRKALPQMAERLWTLGHDVLWSEAFSYALSRALYDHLPVDVAVFTQMGFDHLGMHRSLASYMAAKERLFQSVVLPGGTVVVDPTADGARRVLDIAHRRELNTITTGHEGTVEISSGALRIGRQRLACTVPFAELVMVRNLELAVAASVAIGLKPEGLASAIATIESPPGRFEILELGTPFRVVVDSAHNGDALEASLTEWRTRTPGRVLAVVASVGTSDESRWEPIGEVAEVLADVVVVTDESPHQGHAERIRAAIKRGCPRALEITDRRAAIKWVIDEAVEGDTVIITGRADEDFLVGEHGSVSYPTDAELAAEAVAARPQAHAATDQTVANH